MSRNRLGQGRIVAFASDFEDRDETAVVEMLKRKQAGLPPGKPPQAAAPTNVVSLMDALRRSVEREKSGRAAPRKSAKKPAKQAERRPAMGRKGRAEPRARSCAERGPCCCHD
jgi:DNA end-binding protein Ku